MAIVNSSDIATGFSNLASLFAPPSAQDSAAYADASLKRQKQEEIAKLFAMSQGDAYDPSAFDRGNIVVGNYAPTQSFYAQNQNDATARRGQDITANTSLTNNAADNTEKFAATAFGPLNQGQVRPEVPASIAGLFGIDQGLPQVAGAPKPLTAEEWQAGENQRLLDAGKLTDADLVAAANGKIPVTNIVGPNGQPVVARTPDAVGQQPYFNKGADAKPENMVALMPDGKTQVPAIQGEDGKWYNAQTKDLLPTNIQIFKVPQAVGTSAQIGLGKTTSNDVEQQLIDIAITKDTAVKLRDLIAKSPSSQGVVGWLRGTAQNVVETGGELGDFFGGKIKEITDDIKNGAANADLAGNFDPKIPAIDMLSNLLAFQFAKTTTGNRQLSNEQLKAAKTALGLDKLDANQADSLARLDQAIAAINSQASILNNVRAKGINATGDIPDPSTGKVTMGDSSEVPQAWIDAGGDADTWSQLTGDEKQQVLDGN